MKFTILLTLFSLCISMAFGQNNSRVPESSQASSSERVESEQIPLLTSEPIIAELIRTEEGTNYIYTFASNKEILASQEDRWENRFKSRFMSLIDIDISAINQSIEITLVNTHTPAELLEIVQRFNYSNYEIAD